MASTPLRTAIIGHTGRGSYGHGLDLAFVGVEGAAIVALSDPDEAGRQAALEKRSGIHPPGPGHPEREKYTISIYHYWRRPGT